MDVDEGGAPIRNPKAEALEEDKMTRGRKAEIETGSLGGFPALARLV